jgi:hypothetical protein
MRNARKHLVWTLGLALALGVTGVANAASTQSLEAAVCKKSSPCPGPTPKLDKKKFKNASLFVHTKTEGASGVGPTPAIAALPAETQTADIDFSKNIKFTTKGLEQCNVSQVGGDTQSAIAACPDAVVGSGNATGNCAGGLVTPAVVTAFNSTPVNGHPAIILHSFVSSPLATTIPLIGELIDSPKSGFGKRLHVPVDPLLGGACTLVDFQTVVGAKYQAKSAKSNKSSTKFYISARCKGKKFNFSSDWTYYNGAPPVNDVATTSACKT